MIIEDIICQYYVQSNRPSGIKRHPVRSTVSWYDSFVLFREWEQQMLLSFQKQPRRIPSHLTIRALPNKSNAIDTLSLLKDTPNLFYPEQSSNSPTNL